MWATLRTFAHLNVEGCVAKTSAYTDIYGAGWQQPCVWGSLVGCYLWLMPMSAIAMPPLQTADKESVECGAKLA